MPKRSYAIIGCGGVGGFYGGRLQRSGHEVHFLLHSDYDHVKSNGLTIESCDGDFVLPTVNAHIDPRNMPICDVVMIALKSTTNNVLAQILPHIVGNNTIVLLLQNGLGVENEIAEIIGDNKIISGLCFLCSTKIKPGYIKHLDYGFITFGDYSKTGKPKQATEHLIAISKDFHKSGISTQITEDLLTARWKKLVWNIPFNGLTVLLNTGTSELMNNPKTYLLIKALMNEVVTASASCARKIEPKFVTDRLAKTATMKPYKPSMKLDYDAGRPMEITAIYKTPIEEARKKGIAMPRTESLYQELCFLEKEGGDSAPLSSRGLI